MHRARRGTVVNNAGESCFLSRPSRVLHYHSPVLSQPDVQQLSRKGVQSSSCGNRGSTSSWMASNERHGDTLHSTRFIVRRRGRGATRTELEVWNTLHAPGPGAQDSSPQHHNTLNSKRNATTNIIRQPSPTKTRDGHATACTVVVRSGRKRVTSWTMRCITGSASPSGSPNTKVTVGRAATPVDA